jgi:hypothetical protein
MRRYRREPEGFDEDMQRLIDLQRQRKALDAQIDDAFLLVAVEKNASTSSIAEWLNVKPPVVSVRRQQALRRRQERQQGAAAA